MAILTSAYEIRDKMLDAISKNCEPKLILCTYEYYGGIRSGMKSLEDLLMENLKRGVRVTLFLGHGAHEAVRALKEAGVEVLHNEDLHLKLLYNGKEVILGSANLTRRGLGIEVRPHHEIALYLSLPKMAKYLSEADSVKSRIDNLIEHLRKSVRTRRL